MISVAPEGVLGFGCDLVDLGCRSVCWNHFRRFWFIIVLFGGSRGVSRKLGHATMGQYHCPYGLHSFGWDWLVLVAPLLMDVLAIMFLDHKP